MEYTEQQYINGAYRLVSVNKALAYKIPLHFQYMVLKMRISPTFGGSLTIHSNYIESFRIDPALNVGGIFKINKQILLMAEYNLATS